MAVFTEVSFDEAAAFLNALNLGQLQSIKGAAGGIENTNYFVDTDQGHYVLTLFERLTFEQLPYYLHLMKHLAARGIPVPDPAENGKGEILHRLKGKPTAVVNKLRGHSELAPTPAHCAAVGEMLARMHLAGLDYPRQQPNLRGLAWWNETVPVVLPHLTPEQRSLILGELAYQNHVTDSSACRSLPRGAVHADLFRDNVMFEDGKLTGFFDFYFAGCDTFLFDIGVCLNDWCIDLDSGAQDSARADAFVAAYQSVRRLTAQERTLLPAMQRAGALRFWISRLWDFHLPREAAVLKAHDPGHFERVLRQRLTDPYAL
ncbi:homoserine kinase [Polaromonas sp. JS666]|uniref:homoserine kinase n=1 Tax=Polaromonas sp. (strain JS666 / ATCC BAA-500) TaxID=296591 RepID=UPI0000465023|nr:homoserine kinase [Polaromonas sp. JS666]ABE43663.1 homoserine kinase [Polaromonas sp. JS666]